MHRLLIQPSYSIEYGSYRSELKSICCQVAKTRDHTIPNKDASVRSRKPSTSLVSQNGLGSKNILAINADVERHALLCRSVKCGVLEHPIKHWLLLLQ